MALHRFIFWEYVNSWERQWNVFTEFSFWLLPNVRKASLLGYIFKMPCAFHTVLFYYMWIGVFIFFIVYFFFFFGSRDIRMVSCCIIHGFKFRIFFLLDWLPHKVREAFLPCLDIIKQIKLSIDYFYDMSIIIRLLNAGFFMGCPERTEPSTQHESPRNHF